MINFLPRTSQLTAEPKKKLGGPGLFVYNNMSLCIASKPEQNELHYLCTSMAYIDDVHQ